MGGEVALTALDSAFKSTTVELPFNIDRTPPIVALVAPAPPRYTNATSVTLL